MALPSGTFQTALLMTPHRWTPAELCGPLLIRPPSSDRAFLCRSSTSTYTVCKPAHFVAQDNHKKVGTSAAEKYAVITTTTS
jgi:hypothetical protein